MPILKVVSARFSLTPDIRRDGTTMQFLERASLLHGAVPVLLDTAAFVLLGSLAYAWRRYWRRLAIASTTVFVGLVWFSHTVDIPKQFHGDFPGSFFIWAAFPFVVLVMVGWNWTVTNGWQRGMAFAAIPILVLFGAAQVNEFFGYIPKVGDLFGAPLPGEVTQIAGVGSPVALSRTMTAAVRTMTPKIGVLLHADLPAASSHFAHRNGFVWLPPAWFSHPRPALPAVMLLEGTPGSPDNWPRVVGVLDVANRWAATHGAVAPILVIPDSNGSFLADTECVNGAHGQSETYLTRDVVGWVEHNFGVPGQKMAWGVAGLSEGGTCAIDLALRNPRLFAAFADFSGDLNPNLGTRVHTIERLYSGQAAQWNAHSPLHLLATHRYPSLHGWFEAGLGDSTKVPIGELAAAARRVGISVQLRIRPGGHNFYFWKRAFADSYPWMVRTLNNRVT